MFRALLLTFTVAAAAAILVSPVQAKSSGLTGEVGPGYSIEVKKGNKDAEDDQGRDVQDQGRGQGLDSQLPSERALV